MKRPPTSLVLIIVLLSLMTCGSSAQPVINRHQPIPTQSSAANVIVWVNTNSGVYHCPNTRWYGKTKSGRFMTQREAQSKGYRPAYGAVCG